MCFIGFLKFLFPKDFFFILQNNVVFETTLEGSVKVLMIAVHFPLSFLVLQHLLFMKTITQNIKERVGRR